MPRTIISLEAGPHPAVADLAKDVGIALGAMVTSPTVSEHDRHAATPLALSLARLQANCRAVSRCPLSNASSSIIVVTDSFFADTIFVTDAVDIDLLQQTHALYGRRLGIDVHIAISLDIPLSELHYHAVARGEWPKCSLADLSRLPERFNASAVALGLARATLVRTVTCAPHFDNCETEMRLTVASIVRVVEALVRRVGGAPRSFDPPCPVVPYLGYIDFTSLSN